LLVVSAVAQALENQLSRFLTSLAASSVAFSTMCSSNLFKRSFAERTLAVSGDRLPKDSLSFFLKFVSSLFLRMVLSSFIGRSVMISSLLLLFCSGVVNR